MTILEAKKILMEIKEGLVTRMGISMGTHYNTIMAIEIIDVTYLNKYSIHINFLNIHNISVIFDNDEIKDREYVKLTITGKICRYLDILNMTLKNHINPEIFKYQHELVKDYEAKESNKGEFKSLKVIYKSNDTYIMYFNFNEPLTESLVEEIRLKIENREMYVSEISDNYDAYLVNEKNLMSPPILITIKADEDCEEEDYMEDEDE